MSTTQSVYIPDLGKRNSGIGFEGSVWFLGDWTLTASEKQKIEPIPEVSLHVIPQKEQRESLHQCLNPKPLDREFGHHLR